MKLKIVKFQLEDLFIAEIETMYEKYNVINIQYSTEIMLHTIYKNTVLYIAFITYMD